MPSNRSVLHDIVEKNLKPHKAYTTGKDGTLTAAGKPVIEVTLEPPIVEPEVFGKPHQHEVQDEPVDLPEPMQKEVTQETQTFQKETEPADHVTVTPVGLFTKRRSKKNSVDL